MEFEHVPVLYNEVMEALNIKADGTYVDGTAGGGGHASGIASHLSESGLLIAVDRDREALEAAENSRSGEDADLTNPANPANPMNSTNPVRIPQRPQIVRIL